MMRADYILKSNAVFTGKENRPFPGGIVVKGNRIIEVTDKRTVDRYEANQVIDYGDKLIMAGFVDAHVHYFMGAIAASEHMCTEIANSVSEKNCVDIVKKFAEKHPNEKRILGIGWFPANWKDASLPSKESLDAVFPDKPVYLIAADVHTLWMNTRALQESEITSETNPRSGSVGIDEKGELNGLLFEPDAMAPAMIKIQEFSTEEMVKLNKDFLCHIAECGVTSISEMSADPYEPSVFKKYCAVKEMEQRGILTARMHIYTELAGHRDFSELKKWRRQLDSEKLRISGVKGFLDGVTSTFTGMLLEPYSDRPETRGIQVPNLSREDVELSIIAANKAGFSVRLHAIADGSVRMALDMYETSNRLNGNEGICNTIEHIEHIHPDDLRRFKELHVIPSMQPYHLILDQMEKVRRIGIERCRWEWPCKSLIKAGAKLAFGTDYPVVDFNPYPTIYAAVTRMDRNGNSTSINPQECISMAEALNAYTSGAAKAYGRDDIGTLEKGKLADIIVVDKNLFEIPLEEVHGCRTVMTMFDGKIIFEI